MPKMRKLLLTQLQRFANKAICWSIGHEMYVVQEFSHYSRRIACSKCKRSFAVNDDVRACLEWDSNFEALYKFLGHTIIKPWR